MSSSEQKPKTGTFPRNTYKVDFGIVRWNIGDDDRNVWVRVPFFTDVVPNTELKEALLSRKDMTGWVPSEGGEKPLTFVLYIKEGVLRADIANTSAVLSPSQKMNTYSSVNQETVDPFLASCISGKLDKLEKILNMSGHYENQRWLADVIVAAAGKAFEIPKPSRIKRSPSFISLISPSPSSKKQGESSRLIFKRPSFFRSSSLLAPTEETESRTSQSTVRVHSSPESLTSPLIHTEDEEVSSH